MRTNSTTVAHFLIGLGAISEQNAPLLHVSVHLSLESRHVTLDDVLHLVRELRLHLFLESTQEEGTEDLVQTTDDENCLLLIQLHLYNVYVYIM